MGISKKKTFALKTYGSDLYKWSPQSNDKTKAKVVPKPYFCTATPRSQGEDWITTYAYTIEVTPAGVAQRLAYVECGYVE
jgi:hypothetical protein